MRVFLDAQRHSGVARPLRERFCAMRKGHFALRGRSENHSVHSAKAFWRLEATPRAILCAAQRHFCVLTPLREPFCAMRKGIFAFRGRSESHSVRCAKAFWRFFAAPRAILCDAQKHFCVSRPLLCDAQRHFCAPRPLREPCSQSAWVPKKLK